MEIDYIKIDETPETGIERLCMALLTDAEVRLSTFGETDQVIHEVRKDFKKFRALLRMVRDTLGETQFKKVNVWARDAGRHLSDARDSEVMVVTLKSLGEMYPELLSDHAFAALNQNLDIRHASMISALRSEDEPIDKILSAVKDMQRSSVKWHFGKAGFETFYGGIRRVYKRGLSSGRAAAADPSVANLHEWRKRVKYLYYQLGYLRKLWPKVMKAYERELERLSDLLGADHDLAVLQQTLDDHPMLYEDDNSLQLFAGIIRGRRLRLQEDMWPLYERLYAVEPTAFADQLASFWTAMKLQPGS